MSRIIIAEDDDILAEVVRDILIDAGHAVGVLERGEDAMVAIRLKRPDLVILDCNLPGISGVQVLQKMRIESDLWDTPVLMLTARTSNSDEKVAMFAGADEYMRKPFDPDQLIVTVNRLIAGAEERRARMNAPRAMRAI
ncbi:response regulator transcription factor [Qipengyuania sp.]|uniref:response regulator transcription factor n=1 Tax=Qipengyuania sp. TaxID=2004515 RepID=UPI0035C805AD